jgi:hypothetical protein
VVSVCFAATELADRSTRLLGIARGSSHIIRSARKSLVHLYYRHRHARAPERGINLNGCVRIKIDNTSSSAKLSTARALADLGTEFSANLFRDVSERKNDRADCHNGSDDKEDLDFPNTHR